MCIISTALNVPKRIFAVLYVSVMGLTRCYKTTVFFTFILVNVCRGTARLPRHKSQAAR